MFGFSSLWVLCLLYPPTFLLLVSVEVWYFEEQTSFFVDYTFLWLAVCNSIQVLFKRCKAAFTPYPALQGIPTGLRGRFHLKGHFSD